MAAAGDIRQGHVLTRVLTGVTLGCPLLPAAGRALRSWRRLLASQCCRTLWQKSRCPVHLAGSPRVSLGAVSSRHTAAAPEAGGTGAGREWEPHGGVAQEGPLTRPAQGVPKLSAPLCQHPAGPGALQEHKWRCRGSMGPGLPPLHPPSPAAPPGRCRSPSTRCPWPGLTVYGGREGAGPCGVPWRGQAGRGQAGAGSSPGSSCG